MKPLTKFNRIYQEKWKKCFVFYTGVFLCMCWSGIAEGTKCGRPGRTTINFYEPFKDEFNEDETIRYMCNEDRHVILENPERRCLKNGIWSDDIPVCYRGVIIERVELLFQDSENEDYSSYTIDGDLSTCSQAPILNRTFWKVYLTSTTTVSAVRVSFIDRKEVTIDIQVQEENSNVAKRCKMNADEGTSIKSIKTLTFYCPEATIGKYLHVSCNNLSLTFCEISVFTPPGPSCLSPDIPLKGKGRKSFYNEGTKYQFLCLDGYKIWGSVEVTCQENGRWLPKSPVCEEIYCHVPESIENGSVEYSEIKGRIPYNGIAKYSCKEGYELFGKRLLKCFRWQEWDFPPPVCKQRVLVNTNSTSTHIQTESRRQADAMHCGNLPQIANGALTVNSSHVGSTAWLKCSEGFRPLTDDRISCLPSGKWSSSSLHCAIIQCDAHPIIPHGEAILLNNSTYYGSYLQIKCNQGYESHGIITRKCDEYGSWGDINICVEITCGTVNVEDVNNGQWLPVNGSTSFYVLICPESFHIEGSPAVIRCLSNGSWSYTSARCQKFLTSFWGSNWTPSLMLIAAVAVGAVTAIAILFLSVTFLVIRKRRQTQTNTTVFHLEDTDKKFKIRESNSHRQKHHSTLENSNTVELRSKSVCTIPRKPRSALPTLPVDADPVYAQPFETATPSKKISITAVNKKDDLYNTHIYAEPVNSRRQTPTHILVNIDNLQIGTDRRLSVITTNLENELSNSVQSDQQNCDKKCAIYDSSRNSCVNRMEITKEECFKNHKGNAQLVA